jgi:hypothetical protein
MKDNYDFSDVVKNPFAGKINGKYTVIVHYDFTDKDIKDEEASHGEKADRAPHHQEA